MQNDTCYILALIKRDDGERLLLGSGFYEFTKEQKHFNPNLFANDVVELQGADGQLLAGQVRRSTAQSFDGYIGDGTTSKQTVEQKRREFFLFFRKQHHYTVVYIMPDGTAIKRDRGYIVDAPAVQELYQVQPKWHVSLAFEDVNYYSYAEDSQGQEIYAFSADLNLASVLAGGLIWDGNGAVSTPAGLDNIQINGDTFQQSYEGKNLFNVVTAINNHWLNSQNGKLIDDSNPNVVSDFIEVTSGTTYTISGADDLRIDVWQYTAKDENTGTARIILLANQSHSFTPGTSWIRFAVGSGDAISVKDVFMLEAGSTATSFEPYVGGTPSPNPDYPQAIQTVTGEQTVSINGTDFPLTLKSTNLFDKNSLTVGSLQGDGSVAGTNVVYQTTGFIKVEPSTTYYKTVSNSARLKFYDAQMKPLSAVYDDIPDAGGAQAFTTPANAHYMRLTVTSGYFDVLQIELGSTPTAYTPFMEIDLYGFGDRIWKDGNDWKVHKATHTLTLDGSDDEGWGSTGTNVFATLANWSIGVANTPIGLCTHAKFNPVQVSVTSTLVNGEFAIQRNNPGHGRIFFKNTAISTVEEFKAWANANLPQIIFNAYTTTDTAITDATLIAQLNAIEEAMGADGKPTAIVPTGNNLAAIIAGEPNGTGGYEWEASEGGGPSFITVEGVDDALPVWHVVGPATNPTLTNSSNGLSITWNGTVPAGQELIVDMGAQTATMEGANVFQYISGSWLTLSPGTNRIAYTAANTTAGSKIYWNEIVG